MMEFKGTPGPWEIEMKHQEIEPSDDGKSGFHALSGYLKCPTGDSIASVLGTKCYTGRNGWVAYEEAEYNAALIASAPDLLKACQLALNIRDLWGVPDDISGIDECHSGEMSALSEMENVLKSAINKALNIKP